jgi:membrane fusion protein, multidrug efflux system
MWLSRFLVIAPALCLLIAAATAAHAQEAPPAPTVIVAPAKIMDLRESADFTGRVVADQKVGIRARVAGFLESVNFTEGQKVAANSLLYEVEDGAYRAAVEEIDGSIRSAEAAKRLAEIDRDRKAQLVARKTSPQSELDVADAQLDKAEGELMRLNGSRARAELDLSYTKIIAPFEGIVGLTAVHVGALVGPDTGSLVTLTRLDPINVEFPVATAAYLRYREAEQRGEVGREPNIRIILPDGTTYPKKGKINFVASNVAQGTDTVIVRAVFDNPDATLLDGALVRVTLEDTTPQNVLSVPQQAVQRDQAGAFVMVVGQDSTVEMRRVDIARNVRGQAVISKGLKEGERVITDGVGKVRPGIKVEPVQETGG